MKNRFGVIDIGSNSVRMVIYDLDQAPPAKLFNEKVYCALGRDLTETGRLNPVGMSAAMAGLRAYADIAAQEGLVALDVVGTAALRDASDGAAFIERVEQETGLRIRLISGEEEARYAALGVLSHSPGADGIVGDFGGGSLEFARVVQGRIEATTSKPYGAFRALAMGETAEQVIQSGLSELKPVYGESPALYAIGGSWRALAQAYKRDALHDAHDLQGYSIPRGDMVDFCTKIEALSPEDLIAAYGFDDNKAALAPISALVLRQVMTGLSPDRLIVSTAGIRDGIVYDFRNS